MAISNRFSIYSVGTMVTGYKISNWLVELIAHVVSETISRLFAHCLRFIHEI